MSAITFSDGQTVDSDKILRVGVLEREESYKWKRLTGRSRFKGQMSTLIWRF